MISAFARGYAVLADEQYREAAEAAANFILTRMYNPASKVLLRRFCEGDAAIEGFLDDYAFLAQALLDLFEITSETAYLKTALDLVNEGFSRFEDAQVGRFLQYDGGSRSLATAHQGRLRWRGAFRKFRRNQCADSPGALDRE